MNNSNNSVLLPPRFPDDGKEVLSEALDLGPKDGPVHIEANLPYGLQVTVAHVNKVDYDLHSSHLYLARKLYQLLQECDGRIERLAVVQGGSSHGACLDYTSLTTTEAAQVRADPRKAKPASLVQFCLSNRLDMYGCVSQSDMAVVVNRALRKEKNRARRDALEATALVRAAEAKQPKGLMDKIVTWMWGAPKEQ